MSKINIDDIRLKLSKSNWKLLSDSYKNLDEQLIFECPAGHKVFNSWKRMRDIPKCPTCAQVLNVKANNEIVKKPKNVTRVLAIDQATYISGWAIFDNNELVKFGSFETKETNSVSRFYDVKMWLLSMIESWKPDYIGLEDIQFQEQSEGRRMGVTVFQSLAQLQGVLMETCYENNIEFKLCSTNTWRHFCGVKGKTRTDRKRSMQLLIKDWYNVAVSEDEADAIGIGKYMLDLVSKAVAVENWE